MLKLIECRRKVWIAMLVTGVITSGCQSKKELVSEEENNLETIVIEEQAIEQPVVSNEVKTSKNKTTTLQEDIISNPNLQIEEKGIKDIYAGEKIIEKTLSKKEPFYKTQLKNGGNNLVGLSVSFAETPIPDAVPAFAEVLKFNYLIHPDVKGNVTMTVNSKMSQEKVWEMFEQILWLAGAYCSSEGDFIHILPLNKMPQERNILTKSQLQSNVEVVLMPIHNASSVEIFNNLKPFLTDGATIINIERQNSILLVETPSNVEKLKSIATLLDKKNKANWPKTAINCVNVSSGRIKSELESIMPILGFPVSTDKAFSEAGAIHLTSLERLQVIVASAANKEALDELKKWVGILDKSDVGEQERVFVYDIINGNAGELTSALSTIFSVNASSISHKGSKKITKVSSKRKTKSKSKQEGIANVFEVPVNIFTDEVQSRLVIKTTPRTYAMIKAVLARLDTGAAKILLQVMIAEVTLNDKNQFGFSYSRTNNEKGEANFDFAGSITGGLTASIAKGGDIMSSFRALANDGNTEILSAPQIAVLSHEEAKIIVGDRIPIVTSENTDGLGAGDGNTINREIQYVDTGIILKMIPHVTKGGLITVELEQEVSEANKTESDGSGASTINSPTITKTELNTILSLRNGETIMVGGLIKTKNEDKVSKIPLLGDIPFIGKIFSYTYKEKAKKELLVMITATIVSEESDLEKLKIRYARTVNKINSLDKKKK